MIRSTAIGILASLLVVAAAAAAAHEPADDAAWRHREDQRVAACNARYQALPDRLRRADSGEPGIAALAPYRAEILAYDDACYEPFDALKPRTRAFVATVSGLLFSSAGTDHKPRPLCAAFRLSQRAVVTAAHCMTDGRSTVRATALAFRVIVSPERAFPVTHVLAQGRRTIDSDERNDWAVLAVDTTEVPLSADVGSYLDLLPEPLRGSEYRPLLIPAFSIWRHHFALGGDPDRWVEAVRADRTFGCSPDDIHETSPGIPEQCLIVRCQTLGMMSGAAIYGFDDRTETVRVLGIHLRSGDGSGRCGRHPGHNVGVILPDAVRAFAR